MQKPKALKKGDTIGLVAPSGPVKDLSQIDKAVKIIEEWGFKAKLGKAVKEQYGYMAGREEGRVADIHEMFADDSVDGIFCIRGGYGTPRIAGMLDMDLIKKNPKVFVGYSDITTLLIMLAQQGDMVSFHGPMPTSDFTSDKFGEYSKDSLLNTVTSTAPLGELKNPEGHELQCLSPGVVTAPIIGGNLTLIGLTMGTPYEIDLKDKILLIEDISEEPHKIDGRLCQLKNAGKLDECAGFIIGDFNDAIPYNTNPSLLWEEVINDLIIPTKKPVLGNLRAGHCEPKITVPFGVPVTLDATNKKIICNESFCI